MRFSFRLFRKRMPVTARTRLMITGVVNMLSLLAICATESDVLLKAMFRTIPGSQSPYLMMVHLSKCSRERKKDQDPRTVVRLKVWWANSAGQAKQPRRMVYSAGKAKSIAGKRIALGRG